LATLPQLLSPQSYRPCDWDLCRDEEGRRYWVSVFCEHLTTLVELIRAQYPRAEAAGVRAFQSEYLDVMHRFASEPEQFETADVLRLTELRRDLLNRYGFHDPFSEIKRRENAAALELLPDVLAEIDGCPATDRPVLLAANLMAGNMFDLGSLPTLNRYRDRRAGFHQTRAELRRRPWLIDDLDAWSRRWQPAGPYRHVLFFVDNAGSDIVLGCIPLARWMLQKGARVTLAANSGPALNDITALELRDILPHAAHVDTATRLALDQGRLAVVASGSTTPLLDLKHLSRECAAAAADADIIIFHGMGRAIESNFTARLGCDAVWSAILKDPAVAAHAGGRLFDGVLRFRPGGRR